MDVVEEKIFFCFFGNAIRSDFNSFNMLSVFVLDSVKYDFLYWF